MLLDLPPAFARTVNDLLVNDIKDRALPSELSEKLFVLVEEIFAGNLVSVKQIFQLPEVEQELLVQFDQIVKEHEDISIHIMGLIDRIKEGENNFSERITLSKQRNMLVFKNILGTFFCYCPVPVLTELLTSVPVFSKVIKSHANFITTMVIGAENMDRAENILALTEDNLNWQDPFLLNTFVAKMNIDFIKKYFVKKEVREAIKHPHTPLQNCPTE